MPLSLLLVFVVRHGLLPRVYLQRRRRQWQWVIRDHGVATEAVVVCVTPVRSRDNAYTIGPELTSRSGQRKSRRQSTRVSISARHCARAGYGAGSTVAHPAIALDARRSRPPRLNCRPP